MAVKVVVKGTGDIHSGKFASVETDSVSLFSGIMADKRGGFRGCGRKQVFPLTTVVVTADDPAVELRRR